MVNALECFDDEFPLRYWSKTVDSDEWGGGIERCVNEDLVSGFLVSRPSYNKSDSPGHRRVQPKVYRFISVVHIVEIVHVSEGHSEGTIACEVDCRPIP